MITAHEARNLVKTNKLILDELLEKLEVRIKESINHGGPPVMFIINSILVNDSIVLEFESELIRLGYSVEHVSSRHHGYQLLIKY